jgi:hypothetical protein
MVGLGQQESSRGAVPMRLCWSGEDRHNDFEVLVGGKAAGRCHLMKAADNREVWRWTVYGVSGSGIEDTACGNAAALQGNFTAAQ